MKNCKMIDNFRRDVVCVACTITFLLFYLLKIFIMSKNKDKYREGFTVVANMMYFIIALLFMGVTVALICDMYFYIIIVIMSSILREQ